MNKKLRLLIVDDEQIVLDGIKYMIEKNFHDIEIIGMARSGREAIEACQHVVPDIIFMDIKMPGITGIEAVETIKRRHHAIHFVIISAYEQFDYAKQAMELGVSDYLLKPVTPSKINEILPKIMEEIREERRQRARDISNQEKLRKVIPILEHGFIYSILMNNTEEMHRYQELFEINKDQAYVMIFELGEGTHRQDLQNKIGVGIRGQSFYEDIQTAIKYKCKAIVGPMIINRMVVLIYEEPYKREYDQRLKALELAQTLYDMTQDVVDCNLYIGIGGCYSLSKIRNSLEEASYALNKLGDEHVVHANDLGDQQTGEQNYTYVEIKDDQRDILHDIEYSQQQQLKNRLDEFFAKLQREYSQQLEYVKTIVTELMVMTFSYCYRHQLTEKQVGYSTYLLEIKDKTTFMELRNWVVTKILYIASIIEGQKGQHVSKIIKQAKEYIDEHYQQELSLQQVSKEVAVSPQYFSKLFKEEIGVSFVEYLRNKRIEVAKEMLKAKTYSVKEICYEIGYNDPNYFSRLFKKLVGVSPTEYK